MDAATQTQEKIISPPQGLSTAEVQERIKRGESNAFKLRVSRTYWQIIRSNILNTFNVVLFVMLLIVLLSQDYATVLFAGFSVVTNSLMGTIQELNGKRKLQKLAELAPQQVRVWRDSSKQVIHSQQVVKDEVIVIEPGDRVVVDGVIIASDGLEIDESHLTGESDAIYKEQADAVYSGSFCIAGSGLMRATEVGANSTVNRLSSIAKVYKNAPTPTQRRIASIMRVTLVVLTIFGPMLFVSSYQTEVNFVDTVKNLLVFSTSLVPQGLILVITLSLTIGAVNISRHQTLVQRINAVESMANVTVLCFDKTGTITQNKLSVTDVIPLKGASHEEAIAALHTYIRNLATLNSTAAAIARYLDDAPSPARIHQLIDRIPFNSARKWGAIMLPGQTLILGAPERILPQHYAGDARELSDKGLRVLALARLDALPVSDVIDPLLVQPIALVTIQDQIREDIQETLAAFREQNVYLKVISGDSVETVRAVVRQAGMDVNAVYTGDELKDMSDSVLESVVMEVDIFARVEPETKRRIILALKKLGNHVAMVGDGVNDVPALKAADLAIAMNDGAQITKDIAEIVLLNNAMSTLPKAFYEGTTITQKIYGTTKMFLTKNVYNISLFIFVLFMALPFPITPIQISWAAFGTINIVGGLIALGLIRPAKVVNFRDDVLDYMITVGLTGGVGIALMYVVTYYFVDDLLVTRSATTLFFILYSMNITWNVHGADITHPRSVLANPNIVWTTTLLTGVALAAATLLPDVFEFRWPPPRILILMLLIHTACVLVTHIGLKHRGLLHQFYRLMQR